jgi:hypothetical protein
VRNAALERNGLELRLAGRLATAARIAALAMLHDFGGLLEAADLADAATYLPSHFTRNLKFL